MLAGSGNLPPTLPAYMYVVSIPLPVRGLIAIGFHHIYFIKLNEGKISNNYLVLAEILDISV